MVVDAMILSVGPVCVCVYYSSLAPYLSLLRCEEIKTSSIHLLLHPGLPPTFLFFFLAV